MYIKRIVAMIMSGMKASVSEPSTSSLCFCHDRDNINKQEHQYIVYVNLETIRKS